MAHVTYTGPSDRYELSSADWKVLGVDDATKTVFEKNEPYEVDDNVLQALLGEQVSGFKEVSDAQVEKLLGAAAEDGEQGTPDSSSVQTGIDAAGTGTTTTTTSSTGGRGRARGNSSSTGKTA